MSRCEETATAAEADVGRGQRLYPSYMAERPPDEAWPGLGAAPGLCGACVHAKLNQTRRGTAYLRCTRAEWDTALVRYPRLPVTECAGFERRSDKP